MQRRSASPGYSSGLSSASKVSTEISMADNLLSTFFGGNSEEYASPDDQSTWFKDFSITVNG